MYSDQDATRRKILTAISAAGAVSMAGCGSSDTSSGSDEEPTTVDTVTFTDTAENVSTEAATPTRTETETPEGKSITFAGGDGEAFADALATAGSNPGATLEIEPGTYELEPVTEPRKGKRWHFEPRPLTDVTIEGNGATLVFKNPHLGGIFLEDGENVTFRDLTIDFDPLPFTQGEIVTVDESGQIFEVQLDDGYPPLSHPMFEKAPEAGGLIHEPNGEFIQGVPAGSGRLDKFFESMTKVGDSRWRLMLKENSNTKGISVGNRITVSARANRAVFSTESTRNPTFENVTIHASNAGGFDIEVATTPTIRNCVISPPPDSDRHLGALADGVRLIDCPSDPTVEGCRFEYIGDDGIVVQNTMTRVEAFRDERTIITDNWTIFAKPGDTFIGLTSAGEVIEPLPKVTDVEFKHGKSEERARVVALTFEEPVRERLAVGDFLGNEDAASKGFRVAETTVRNVRGNLIRIATSDGDVVGNRLDGCSSNPIELETDTNVAAFSPKGIVRNVSVRENEISRAGLNYFTQDEPAGIHVHHTTVREAQSSGRPNRNIEVVNNTVSGGAWHGIDVEYTTDVRIEGNTLSDLNQLDTFGGEYGIGLTGIDGATVMDNTVRGTDSQLSQFASSDDVSGLESANNELIIDGESVPAKFVSWIPITFEFSQVVSRDDWDRSLAVRVFSIALQGTDGETIHQTNVGANERGVLFENGVYSREQDQDDSWRWFGGPNATATCSFRDTDLENAETLQLRAVAVEGGISATVSREGAETDTVEFTEGSVRTYDISL